MDLYRIVCPYCQFAQLPRDYEEGFQAVVCFECNKPFVNQTTMAPVFHSFALVGIEPIPEQYDPVREQKQDICKQNTGVSEQIGQNVNKPREGHYWPSEKDVLICAHCGKGYEDHGITDGVCPACFLDTDSVKGLSEKGNNAAAEIAEKGMSCQKDPNGFQVLENNTHVSYRCDGDYIDLRYNGVSNTRTSWADIYTLVEELKESDNISPSIKQLLGDKVGAIAVRAASINAFVRAVQAGTVSEPSAPDIVDADFKPMLSSVVNTRCNYDGSKIGGWS